MDRFFFFILCCLICFFPKQMVSAKTLHAILVADTIHDVRSIAQPNLFKWQKELRMITQHAEMTLKEKVFSGIEFNKEKVRNYLKDLKVEESDAVIFFFSGHGYRTFLKKTPWPFLTFEFYKQGLDLQWVLTEIRNKNPQFALVMSDCCNNFMENGFFGDQRINVIVNLRAYPPQYSSYQKLFGNAKGCIVISSCSEGQFSYGSYLGGLYTQCFFASLNRELMENQPSWKQLLQRANGFINHIQRPICEVYR